MGPGAYDPTRSKAAVRSQPVADFGRMRSQRTDFSKVSADVPDAGMYQPDMGGGDVSVRRDSDPLIRPTATFASRTARKAGAGSAVFTPGPGAYGTVEATTAFKTAVSNATHTTSRTKQGVCALGNMVGRSCTLMQPLSLWLWFARSRHLFQAIPRKNQFFGSSSRRFAGSSRLNCTADCDTCSCLHFLVLVPCGTGPRLCVKSVLSCCYFMVDFLHNPCTPTVFFDAATGPGPGSYSSAAGGTFTTKPSTAPLVLLRGDAGAGFTSSATRFQPRR